MQNGIVLDFTGDFYDDPAELAKRFRLMEKRNRALKNCELYTPPWLIEASRKVLGTIDLDPASCALAQTVVKATTCFTKHDDGLSKEWHGRIFLDPPFGKIIMEQFIDKLISEIAKGNTKEAILITDSKTETKWFRKALAAKTAFCFPKKQIDYWSEKGEGVRKSPGTVFYFGSKPDVFRKVFEELATFI
jgi:ParB family transcriptional regulator, chromosome partitioning protein